MKKKLIPSDKQRNRACSMSLSEMLTIMILYHTAYSKNFKYSNSGMYTFSKIRVAGII